jgi:hypothetical protein
MTDLMLHWSVVEEAWRSSHKLLYPVTGCHVGKVLLVTSVLERSIRRNGYGTGKIVLLLKYNAMESAQFHASTALLQEKGMQWSFQ